MSDGGGLPDLSGLLARVTENPQAMSMLSSLLGGMGEQSEKEPPSHKQEMGERDEARPTLAPQAGRHRKHDDKRRLLLALKPFLTPERQKALDMLLPLLEAISLFIPRKEPPCT